MDELANRMSQHIGAYFKSHQARLETLASDKPPTILFIACIDARVVPELMLNIDPGDMMTLRIPGAVVPPQGLGDVCVAGAVEMVLTNLSSVKDIVVCGHTDCVFNAHLAAGVDSYHLSNLSRWVAMADFARAQASTKADKQSDPDGYRQALLEFTVQRSLQALREMEIVKKKEKAGDITLHGWYFNLVTGQIMVFNEKSGVFEPAGQITVEAKAEDVAAATDAVPQVAQEVQAVPTTAASKPQQPSLVPPTSIPSVAPPAVAAAHQATLIEAKAPETVAPAPVNVPSARPVERVYASEVSRAPSTKSVARQSAAKPAQQQRPQQPTSTQARTQSTAGNKAGSTQAAADSVQAALDQQTLRNLGELLQDVKRPAQRMRLRNMLNQVKSPQGWQMVRDAVTSLQDAEVRQTLRELSIELTSPEARTQLRGIISQLGNEGAKSVLEGVDMSKIEQDFLSILNNLKEKK